MLFSLLLAGSAIIVPPTGPAQPDQRAEINYSEGQLGFTAMQSGQTAEAIRQLEQSANALPNDPGRLINLGTAYARVGRMDDARATLRRAIASPVHFDLILANGRVINSRSAAMQALDRIDQRRNLTIASGN